MRIGEQPPRNLQLNRGHPLLAWELNASRSSRQPCRPICYSDRKRGGFWKFDSSGWKFDKNRPEGEISAGLSFDTFISSDGARALVSVGFYCGQLCGNGYDYVLHKDGNEWKVQAMKSTWVS